MKAIRIHRTGGPEVVQLDEIPVPQPGPGQALVRVKVGGVNFIDVYHRTGLYNMSLPLTLGYEGAGVVEALGEGVTEVKVGDRVAWAMHGGAYAEYAVLPAWKLAPLPAAVSFESGAAVMLQGMTAHYLAYSTFPLKAGDRCVVHAAAGGVGLLLIQVAKRLGATVYGTVGGAEKAKRALAAGADEAILYNDVDFADEVRRLTGGAGVQVVYDSVGRSTWEKSLKCLAPRGYMVSFGQSSGPVPPIETGTLAAHGSIFLTRASLSHYMLTREEMLSRTTDLFGWLAGGQLKLTIDSTFPLAEVGAAHKRLESRQSVGKILIRID